MRLKPLGLVGVTSALILPVIWLLPLAQKYDTGALFSQYLGMAALIGMALTQVIATRLSFVEQLFGGLDRCYILHKWLGILSMGALLLHDTIDADMDGLGRETALTDVAETMGEISLYGLLILVVITIATFIPYHLWRWTHRIMGVFFIMSTFHYLFILKPFSNGDPLALYVSAFCAVGILAFVYKQLPASLRSSRKYKVSDIQQTGTALAITMSPESRPLKHRPGQFSFVTFDHAAVSEPHPFTISNAPDKEGNIRMTIADLGDFSHSLSNHLKVGTGARLEGAYGRFERRATQAPEVWVAAGIGITPFVAWAQALTDADGPVTLVYCVSEDRDANHLDELRAVEAKVANFRVVLHASRSQGRVNAEAIESYVSDIAQAKVYFCGPQRMRQFLAQGLSRLGVSSRRFHFEEFEIRSGVGLRKLAAWLLNRALVK
ncbi:iron reductase [Parasedimentitalea marina]|uniref:Iron reductase n=1 Tax=Parasedimentitalea marina TaxID=2483033 RepID=A0A3T0N344_9RHOB|nr:ferredoxin reductase family protein [Parasedimentitalea marina]AZV78414.1 iron reductase [Parasedimentitalea marina]